jgi:hypothetical protein
MTRFDDSSMEMSNELMLGPGTLEWLLSGRMDPEDAPRGYAGVAELVRALRAPATPAELAGKAAAVAAASALLTTPPPPVPVADDLGSRRSERARRIVRRTKVMSLVFVGTVLGTSGLAAAGALPGPVQDVAHRILEEVGIHVPSSSDDDATTPSSDPRDDVDPHTSDQEPASVGVPVADPGAGNDGAGTGDGVNPADGTSPPEGVGPPEGVEPPEGVAPDDPGNGNGPPDDPGNGNGPPDDPGNGNGPPDDPGNGNGPPDDPGNGNGNGQPDDPGNGNGNGQPDDPGNGNGGD